MEIRWILAGLTACSFHGRAIGGDATVTDAAVVDALPAIGVAQGCSNVSLAGGSAISCAPVNPQTIGNTNIVVVDWGTPATLVDLSDAAGNTYVTPGVVGTSDLTF